jgi:hypothetical protein
MAGKPVLLGNVHAGIPGFGQLDPDPGGEDESQKPHESSPKHFGRHLGQHLWRWRLMPIILDSILLPV